MESITHANTGQAMPQWRTRRLRRRWRFAVSVGLRCSCHYDSINVVVLSIQDVVAYVQERRQFGKPLADFQAVQVKIGEMKMKVHPHTVELVFPLYLMIHARKL